MVYSSSYEEVFKQVQINIPFLDAIQQVPAYAKFLKDLVTMKSVRVPFSLAHRPKDPGPNSYSLVDWA